MTSDTIWDTLNFVEIYKCFGRTFCLYLQDRNSSARSLAEGSKLCLQEPIEALKRETFAAIEILHRAGKH
jgi:hypothetical protein